LPPGSLSARRCMFEAMVNQKLISADVCGTVMDSLSIQMAKMAEAHAKTPMQVH
jgi:hypothetical protein